MLSYGTTKAATIDSLTTQLQLTEDLHQQLHLLNQIVEEQLPQDPEAALQYATDAWQIAHHHRLPLELAKAQGKLGNIYLQLGNYQHAAQYLTEVEKVYVTHHQNIPLAQTRLSLGEVANLQEQYVAAGNYLNAALPTLELSNDQLLLAQWKLQMAIRYQGLKQYKKAVKLYQTAIPVLQTADKKYQHSLTTAYKNNFALQQLYNPVSQLQQSNDNAWSTLIVSGIILLFILGLLYRRITRMNREYQTELKSKVAQQTHELKTTNEALADANAELQRFAYISSHDLKEPLRNIASFTTLIKRKLADHLDHDTEEYFQFVSNNTRQIADLVTDIFEYSNLDERDVFFSYVDTNEVMESTLKSLQPLIATKRGSVTYGDLPVLYSNAGYLHLVFKNIIENGLKYNESDCPEVQISCQETRDFFQFNISDNGIGIAPDYHNYIFEMFRRLNSRNAEGSGLGLAICKKILRRLNGKINLTSTPKQGTTFHIILPKNLGQTPQQKTNQESLSPAHSGLQIRLNALSL
ncbi:MAG: ATP-binding protein [Saprospiraceae bacterium]